MKKMNGLVIDEQHIQSNIFTIRGKQVILDSVLAILYKVETRVLNQAVKRNIKRFPLEFMFQLTKEEFEFLISQSVIPKENSLTSQSVTLKNNRGKHRKYLPFVFTEQGISMLSAVLKSANKSITLINNYIDEKQVYHFGASLKDLGKKWFAFSQFDIETFEILSKLGK